MNFPKNFKNNGYFIDTLQEYENLKSKMSSNFKGFFLAAFGLATSVYMASTLITNSNENLFIFLSLYAVLTLYVYIDFKTEKKLQQKIDALESQLKHDLKNDSLLEDLSLLIQDEDDADEFKTIIAHVMVVHKDDNKNYLQDITIFASISKLINSYNKKIQKKDFLLEKKSLLNELKQNKDNFLRKNDEARKYL